MNNIQDQPAIPVTVVEVYDLDGRQMIVARHPDPCPGIRIHTFLCSEHLPEIHFGDRLLYRPDLQTAKVTYGNNLLTYNLKLNPIPAEEAEILLHNSPILQPPQD